MIYLIIMKMVCPGHYCLLEDTDKLVLEKSILRVEVFIYPCPYCKEELRILNVLLPNVSYLLSDSQTSDTDVA